jgi:hypothetical protein
MTPNVSVDGGWILVIILIVLAAVSLVAWSKSRKGKGGWHKKAGSSASGPSTSTPADPSPDAPADPAQPAPKADPPPKAKEADKPKNVGSGIFPIIRKVLVIAVIGGVLFWALKTNGLGRIVVRAVSMDLDYIFTAPSAFRARDKQASNEAAAPVVSAAPAPSTPTAEEVAAAAKQEEDRFSKPILIPDFDYANPPAPVFFPSGAVPHQPIITVSDGKEIQQLCGAEMFAIDAPADEHKCDGVTTVRVWQPRAINPEQGKISVSVTFTNYDSKNSKE